MITSHPVVHRGPWPSLHMGHLEANLAFRPARLVRRPDATKDSNLNASTTLGRIRMEFITTPLVRARARETLLRGLRNWDLGPLAGKGELLVSELAADTTGHGDGTPTGQDACLEAGPGGQHCILCEIAETAPARLQASLPESDSDRGRGLHVNAVLAADSGLTENASGKTAWLVIGATQQFTRELETDQEAEASP